MASGPGENDCRPRNVRALSKMFGGSESAVTVERPVGRGRVGPTTTRPPGNRLASADSAADSTRTVAAASPVQGHVKHSDVRCPPTRTESLAVPKTNNASRGKPCMSESDDTSSVAASDCTKASGLPSDDVFIKTSPGQGVTKHVSCFPSDEVTHSTTQNSLSKQRFTGGAAVNLSVTDDVPSQKQSDTVKVEAKFVQSKYVDVEFGKCRQKCQIEPTQSGHDSGTPTPTLATTEQFTKFDPDSALPDADSDDSNDVECLYMDKDAVIAMVGQSRVSVVIYVYSSSLYV